jgi:pyridoxal biosynthesis lyase PdxS
VVKRVRAKAPVVLAAPDRGGRLSEGALVEAKVRARLFGIPLLKVEATVVLMPAGIADPSHAAHAPPARATRPGVAAGDDLTEAVRSINEGAELLAELRRNGSG